MRAKLIVTARICESIGPHIVVIHRRVSLVVTRGDRQLFFISFWWLLWRLFLPHSELINLAAWLVLFLFRQQLIILNQTVVVNVHLWRQIFLIFILVSLEDSVTACIPLCICLHVWGESLFWNMSFILALFISIRAFLWIVLGVLPLPLSKLRLQCLPGLECRSRIWWSRQGHAQTERRLGYGGFLLTQPWGPQRVCHSAADGCNHVGWTVITAAAKYTDCDEASSFVDAYLTW